MTFNSGVGLTIDTGGLISNNNNTTSFNSTTSFSALFGSGLSSGLHTIMLNNESNEAFHACDPYSLAISNPVFTSLSNSPWVVT